MTWKPDDNENDADAAMEGILGAAKAAFKAMKAEHDSYHGEHVQVYCIPPEHIEPFLILVQEKNDWEAEHKRDSLMRHNALWRYVHSFLPAARDYKCAVDLSCSTKPKIRLKELHTPPRAGINGVLVSYEITGENFTTMENIVDAGVGPLHSYRLWSFINKLHPETAGDQQWTVWNGHESAVVYKKKED